MKHNKQQRQLGALIRLYKRWGNHQHANEEFWYADYGIPNHAYVEADALHKQLPPEMVAWAQITR